MAIRGCTNSVAYNYKPWFTEDDGSCQIGGCRDTDSDNDVEGVWVSCSWGRRLYLLVSCLAGCLAGRLAGPRPVFGLAFSFFFFVFY